MVLYLNLGDRPFPYEIWHFLEDIVEPGPVMVRFGRFGRASFCVVVKRGLFERLNYASLSLWSAGVPSEEVVRVCKFRITVPVNFRYWFIWRRYDDLASWVRVNGRGYRAVRWSEQDRLRSRVVQIFQRCCRLVPLSVELYIAYVGEV